MDDGRRHREPLKALQALAGRFDSLAGGLGAIQRAWPQVVGEQMARSTMPVRLEDGELRVRCASSTWAGELLASSGMVLGKLRAALGPETAPVRIKPYTGRLPATEVAPAQQRPTQRAVLDPAAVAQARSDLAGRVAGPVAESMARAMAASRAQRRG